ncbi:unnamed protein product [Boreogadus saida]
MVGFEEVGEVEQVVVVVKKGEMVGGRSGGGVGSARRLQVALSPDRSPPVTLYTQTTTGAILLRDAT